ncbi:MAG: MBL fold metallo-hydrolase [Paracoccaceae bacterium]|nr:MBL fold metallo-hydrolase [Paracoccaceae bacterium]
MTETTRPVPGKVERLAPGLRRVLAPNPSPMTLHGTNTFLIGEGRVAVIDPGPASAAHLDAILAALSPGETISHILVTHSHLDHSPLARPLAERTGAPVLAHGDSTAGRSAAMTALAARATVGGGEGVDTGFAPDDTLADGAEIEGDGWTLTALWTPGHFGNHLSFAWEDAIFCGDLVMGWSSSLVSPPDGDMGDYMASLARLKAAGAGILHPAHGAPVTNPSRRIADLAAHRRRRENQILAALDAGPLTPADLARRIYTETPPALLPAAERNVLAHLIDLTSRKHVHAVPHPTPEAHFLKL